MMDSMLVVRCGSQALLVTREACAGIEQQVVGLITCYHIERRALAHPCGRRHDPLE